ncbi:MAG: hypothetical protein E7208_04210 [Clostridium butyricum]|nr:hypothetical protein [Clostridium butyricum]
MGKPSIFSREYEKKMKKRKRNIIIFSLSVILIVSAVVVKFVYNPIDFTKIKQELQAWIDSDTSNNKQDLKEDIKENNVNEEIIETPKEPIEETIDILLSTGNVAKAVYTQDSNQQNIFTEVKELDEGINYDISPSKKQILINDINGDITVYNVDGTSSVISKNEYISTRGTVFTKADTIANNPNYLWNYGAKFISDEKIIFITNRPYFGNNVLEQYLWITDIPTGTDTVLWNLKGSNIQISTMGESGLEVTVDGVLYYIDQYGNYNQ